MPTSTSTPDFFEVLGVPRRYHLADAELEQAFHAQSRALHPDRHVKSASDERVRAALLASQLNEAYRTLKKPVPRAEYLLRLEGIQISDERSGHKVDPAFLAEILELREALLDARMENDPDKVATLGSAVRQRRDEQLAALDAAFSRYEGGARDALTQAADALVAERYFRRFLDEVEAYEEAQA